MREQIYINGTLMEQQEGKNASLVFQSPFFTDIDAIVSNRTNSVDFPLTEGNLRAIENCQNSRTTSKYAYHLHSVQYFLDGVQIFSGYGTLISITNSAIKFTFNWGNVNSFKALLAIKLRELQRDTDYVPWTNVAIVNNDHYATNINFQATGIHGDYRVTVGHSHPLLRVSDILTRLQEVSGVTFRGAEPLLDLAIPITNRQADERCKLSQATCYTSSWAKQDANPWQKKWVLVTPALDPRKLDIGDGIIDVTDYNTIRITVKAGSRAVVYSDGGHILPMGSLGLLATDESGGNTQLIMTIPMTYAKSGNTWTLSTDADLVKDVDLNWRTLTDHGKYNYLQIALLWVGNAYANTSGVTSNSLDVRVAAGLEEEQEVIFGGDYPTYFNLPDWDASQLLKNLMKVKNLFAVCPDSNTIQFKSISELYSNREEAPDWSDKLILSGDSLPEEQLPTFGSYARKNACKWAEDSRNKKSFNGTLIVENETLSAEADLMQLDFAGTETDDNGVLQIPCYSVNPDGESEAEQFDEVQPRLVTLNGRVADFKTISWENIGATGAYYAYQQIIRTPKVLKAKVLMDAIDLANLDLSVPVYSHALGHYFAITKLTTKGDCVAEAEMLQLGSFTEEINTPTEDSPLNDLTLDQDASGNWFATVPSLSGQDIITMIQSPDYKMLMLRYGYARRGRWFRYVDNQNNNVWSHASRRNVVTSRYEGDKLISVPRYKDLRKGECFRIIGADILYKGQEKEWSQQQRTGYYNEATLVFDLKDPIKLPPMRKPHSNGRSTVVNKSGRINNKATNGLTELWIGLYHKTAEGKWVCVSNLVQVRGRSEDKTKLWEFSRSNIVAVE